MSPGAVPRVGEDTRDVRVPPVAPRASRSGAWRGRGEGARPTPSSVGAPWTNDWHMRRFPSHGPFGRSPRRALDGPRTARRSGVPVTPPNPDGPSARRPRESGRVLRALLGAAGAALVASAAVGAGCGSLDAASVRERSLALQKNAPFRERLRTGTLEGSGEEWVAAHFEAAAEGVDGEAPVVLVHGTPDTMGAWTRVLFGEDGLAGRTPVWTLEVLGHGMCDARPGTVTFQRCADHVAGTLRALGLSGVTLVGNSYGGEFCWRAALDHPDLISRLVLIDSSGLPRTREQFLSEEVKMREWSVARLGYLVNSEPRVASALDPHFDGAADPERVHEVFLGLENRVSWNAMIDLVRDENGGRAAELAGLGAPTLLLWGEFDQAYPPPTFGRTFEERIPDARLVVVEGAGHYPHEQAPARVAREILAFHRGGSLPRSSQGR